MFAPSTLTEVERMIRDRVQESIHLDYKDSRALDPNKPSEIAKDVSSFANSDGGVLVYGVEEEKGTGFPLRIDDGIDPASCSKERVENIITSNITPRVDVRITSLPLTTGRVLVVIEIPKSYSGPHQASDKRYYRRYNFKSAPMEDYEINDVRNRPKRIPPLVVFEATSHARNLAVFDVANIGDVAAEEVQFDFSTVLPWRDEMPYALKNGIHRMPPRQRLRFEYHSFTEILASGSPIPAIFSVTVSYVHPDIGSRQAYIWHVNLNAYKHSIRIRSDAEYQSQQLIGEFEKLNKNVAKLRSVLEPLQSLVSATGLDLSIRTLRNLARFRDGKGHEPLPLAHYPSELFAEVLSVDHEMAYRVYRAFDHDISIDKLRSLQGMTEELLERIRRSFAFPPEVRTE